jgi:hypothetical protein
VLGDGPAGDVVFDQQIVAEAGKDAPAAVAVGHVVANRDMMVRHAAHSGSRQPAQLKTFDHDVVGSLQIDAVRRARIRGVDHDARVGVKRDRQRGGSVSPQIKAGVSARRDHHGIAGDDRIGRLLQSPPGTGRRAGIVVISARGNVQGREHPARFEDLECFTGPSRA